MPGVVGADFCAMYEVLGVYAWPSEGEGGADASSGTVVSGASERLRRLGYERRDDREDERGGSMTEQLQGLNPMTEREGGYIISLGRDVTMVARGSLSTFKC